MKLKDFLKKKKMSQKKFAKLCGVSEPTITRIVHGKISPNLTTCIKIQNATLNKVKHTDLLGG